MAAESPSALVLLDLGTSSTRAALFRDGQPVHQARRPLSIVFPVPGHAEQDPRELLDTSVDALEEVVEHLGKGEIAALGLTNQRSTVVLWDAESGRALGPALSWRDARARHQAQALEEAVPDLAARTGLLASPHYGAPKLAWALAAWPEARVAAEAGRLRVGPLSSWIVDRLTRGESHAVEPTNAQRMLLMDLHSLEWDEALVTASGVPVEALPPILPTDGHFGEALLGERAVPIRAVLGDQQAALIGLGADDGEASIGVHLGTGGFVMRDVGDEALHVDGLLTDVGRADVNRPRRYLLEGPVNSAGSAFDRLRDFAILRADDDVDHLCAAARSPLIVVPAWAGLAAPWWRADARAAIHGWDESTTRADIVAGTVRGVAFLVADIVDAMRDADIRGSHLRLSGPLSAVSAMAQAISDATGLLAHVRTNPEASLEGIGVALAEACGAQPPDLTLTEGRGYRPETNLDAERAAFQRARATCTALADETR